jgi:molybdate transport system substrate-binding protein
MFADYSRPGSSRTRWLILLLPALLLMPPAQAGELRVAVAANFLASLRQLASRFETAEGVEVVPVAGSTGKLYAQIRQGAPYDLFLAADAERPALLEAAGLSLPGSRRTYAVGRLVLWSPRPGYVQGPASLERGGFRHLAIANPRTAPYGAAAVQALRGLGVWERVQDRLVQGESVGQAFQFVASGSAELGLVARGQVAGRSGSSWLLPPHLHDPIEQQLVVLGRTEDPATAERFVDFLLQDPEAATLVRAAGYDLPEPADAHPR